jgi:hypothetical protein
MAASEAVYRAIYTCWNEDVFLQELAGRFWKLTLQVRIFRMSNECAEY